MALYLSMFLNPPFSQLLNVTDSSKTLAVSHYALTEITIAS